ncbi:MAG: hypothetical protein AAB403_08660, partial [Planctomycetota bacterium]
MPLESRIARLAERIEALSRVHRPLVWVVQAGTFLCFQRGICVPRSSSLSLEEQLYVINQVREA